MFRLGISTWQENAFTVTKAVHHSISDHINDFKCFHKEMHLFLHQKINTSATGVST